MAGWSMGGYLTLLVVTQHGDMISHVVLIDAHGGPELPGPADIKSALGQARKQGLPYPAAAFYPDTEAGNAGLCRLLALQKAMPADIATAEQNKAEPSSGGALPTDDFLRDNLPNITNPVLIIAGIRDAVDPFENDVSILSSIPGASLLQYADAGHASMLQHALSSAAIITAFLDDDA